MTAKSETPLRVWMSANKRTFRWMMVQLKVKKLAVVEDMVDGRKLPSLVHAFKIAHITGGAVPVTAWANTVLFRELWHPLADDTHLAEDLAEVRAATTRSWNATRERQKAWTKAQGQRLPEAVPGGSSEE